MRQGDLRGDSQGSAPPVQLRRAAPAEDGNAVRRARDGATTGNPRPPPHQRTVFLGLPLCIFLSGGLRHVTAARSEGRKPREQELQT